VIPLSTDDARANRDGRDVVRARAVERRLSGKSSTTLRNNPRSPAHGDSGLELDSSDELFRSRRNRSGKRKSGGQPAPPKKSRLQRRAVEGRS